MSQKSLDTSRQAELRSKAVAQLGAHRESEAASRSVPPAYEVLHKLASSPATAVDALALLHELQVHQVELELQAEEMRRAHAESEAMLHRQGQLYESAPVGCFTVDSDTAIVELNLRRRRPTGRHVYPAVGAPRRQVAHRTRHRQRRPCGKQLLGGIHGRGRVLGGTSDLPSWRVGRFWKLDGLAALGSSLSVSRLSTA